MSRLHYATPEDVVRRALGGTVVRPGSSDSVANSLDEDAILETENDRELIAARLEAAESQWDREATPMRAVPVGSTAAPKYFDAKGSPWPVRIYLDHQNVHPLDSELGDFIETRTGRDQYRDITDREGSAWTADYDEGIITIYRMPGTGQLPAVRQIRDKFVKVSYHLGAGGDFESAGETTLSESLTADESDTGSIDVGHADRLPRSGGTMLLGGTEYVDVEDVDHSANTVTIVSRGMRLTAPAEHDAGTTIHYCPPDVRDAVAAMGAAEIARTEDFTEAMFDGDVDKSSKIEGWREEFHDAVNRYSVQAGYQ